MRCAARWLLMLVIAITTAAALHGAPPPVTELAVDQVVLKRGPRLFGSVLGKSANGDITIVVSREWLRKAHPKFCERAIAAQAVETITALEGLLHRIDAWREKRADAKELAFFLKKERERIEQRLAAIVAAADAESTTFLRLEFPTSHVERVFVQPAPRRQIALTAWREELPAVETSSATALLKELRARMIDPARERIDLTDRLAPARQSDDEWAARVALVEYEFVRPVDFQGTGNLVVRTGSDERAPATLELLLGVLRQQVVSQLADLLEEPGAKHPKPSGDAWLASATQIAGKDGILGFRVTRVTPDAPAGRVAIESRFVARMPAGDYKTVWQHSETLESARGDKDAIERIRNDPRVKPVLDLFGAGGAGAEPQIDTALRLGAATLRGQQTVEARFFEFRDRYLARLDGPPLLPSK
jgi:hypothetical protein